MFRIQNKILTLLPSLFSLSIPAMWYVANGVFPKYFHWILQIQWQKIFVIKGLEPVTSFVRDQDATTAPGRHMTNLQIEPNSCFDSDFSDSLNLPKWLNSMKVLLDIGKTPLTLLILFRMITYCYHIARNVTGFLNHTIGIESVSQLKRSSWSWTCYIIFSLTKLRVQVLITLP